MNQLPPNIYSTYIRMYTKELLVEISIMLYSSMEQYKLLKMSSLIFQRSWVYQVYELFHFILQYTNISLAE
jgi:hypothetical protein